MYYLNFIPNFLYSELFQNRLQIEEKFRKQLDNQQRIEEMNGIDSKTNSNEKFNKLLDTYNKLREEHVIVLRRV